LCLEEVKENIIICNSWRHLLLLFSCQCTS